MSTNLFAIGIDNYTGCRKLNNCVRDVENIIDVLSDKYQFEKSLLTTLVDGNATQTNLIAQLEVYLANQNPSENLVLLFSGHGDYDDKLDMGYLLPVDSTLDNKASYLPNSTLFTYIKALEYRHIVLLFDSCFSGSFFPATKGIPTPKEKLFDIPSKWALTSGRMELVSDGIPGTNSPFATSLITNLKSNTEELFGISELSGKVILEVTGKHNQIPRGEPLQNLGHKGGEFMFKLKSKKTVIIPPTKIELTETENQLSYVIKAYYEVLFQIEEADNDDKFATANRLIEEANSISNIIKKEIIKNLEFAKKNESNTKLFLEILGAEFETTIITLKEINELKNQVVKSQKFEEAASLRDKERKIEEHLFKQIFAKKEEFTNLLKSNEESIVEDYCVLSTLMDFTPIYNKGKTREYLDLNFVNLYFNKLSKDLNFLSPYRFGDIFSNFKSEIFPLCQKKIFFPEKEKLSEPNEEDDDDDMYSSHLYKSKEEPKILGLEPHKLRIRPKGTSSRRRR